MNTKDSPTICARTFYHMHFTVRASYRDGLKLPEGLPADAKTFSPNYAAGMERARFWRVAGNLLDRHLDLVDTGRTFTLREIFEVLSGGDSPKVARALDIIKIDFEAVDVALATASDGRAVRWAIFEGDRVRFVKVD